MTRREQLWENYEEAVFALLMDEIAAEEGKRLLDENERLKRDPSAAIPDEVDRRCRAAIRRSFARQRKQRTAIGAYRVMRRICVAVVVCMLLFATAFAAFPQFRANTLNLLIQIGNISTSLRLTNENIHDSSCPSGNGTLFNYTMPDVPDGFTETFRSESERSILIRFEDQDGAAIHFSLIKASTEGKYNIDTEDARQIKPITIHGYDGLLIEKNDTLSIVWADTEQRTFLSVYGRGVGADTLMTLAEGLLLQQP